MGVAALFRSCRARTVCQRGPCGKSLISGRPACRLRQPSQEEINLHSSWELVSGGRRKRTVWSIWNEQNGVSRFTVEVRCVILLRYSIMVASRWVD
ncbi:hypothetical protein MGG_17969 [Pyricularia oryzae 70-15]|uniref:Uncharacterized protein n=3 Tax=Pyricularia oryzae TaxID=318829 RepID=G5EH11_PYRO7|nr:uncharacterized protein MGG_17969 [Pyricularia oryzae 70-15]EAQ71117.1 hypothetical protein MGCH7_ch7g524 [Pyricularia oryzae 70-15]EHA46231.1 hypothetical protein MGG_17969 [Pyricularia oryzae 70-15]ELQ36142.1 hypothetical protein OOU_Y34scaffold00666g2 [Pyricularia oryzae Y34]KAI7921340.1 hypothetical protein M9X92_005430 [Pyricularia oryzae]